MKFWNPEAKLQNETKMEGWKSQFLTSNRLLHRIDSTSVAIAVFFAVKAIPEFGNRQRETKTPSPIINSNSFDRIIRNGKNEIQQMHHNFSNVRKVNWPT